jgi:lipid A disaccharide synthetase
LPVTVVENATYDAISHSTVAIVASGTASTETALLGTPMVIVYRVSPWSWAIGRWLVNTPYYSMVNIVAARQMVPEFIQGRFRPEPVAREVNQLLDVPAIRERMRSDLADFSDSLRPRFAQQDSNVSSVFGLEPIEMQILDPIQRAAAIAESMLKGEPVTDRRTRTQSASKPFPFR